MTTFRLVNDGPNIHHMQIIRLDSAKTVDDLKAALAKPGPVPAWAVAAGGPNAPDPGSASNTTMNMAAGNYAIVCFVDIPGGVPHFTKGMLQPLAVTPSGAAAVAAPTPDVTISLTDYSFTLSQPVTAPGDSGCPAPGAKPPPSDVRRQFADVVQIMLRYEGAIPDPGAAAG